MFESEFKMFLAWHLFVVFLWYLAFKNRTDSSARNIMNYSAAMIPTVITAGIWLVLLALSHVH